MKKLPIGIQTFHRLIREGYCYVDKTPLIHEMVESGRYYFLSRPRRFGKSLLVSTLKSAFQGEKALFDGLYLEHQWDWDRRHPVVHISLGGGVVEDREMLDAKLNEFIETHLEQHEIELNSASLSGRFSELIRRLHDKYQQPVVVLVDEYDKPILDGIVADQPARALAMREGLKSFYSVIKESDEYLQFVLLTGVSKFSKVSLFSGLNNLEDITLNARYATLCGYTEAELSTVFADYLVDVDLEALRDWYNGYNFLGDKVYNPYDVLLYLKNRVFRAYWFETASPSFLIKRLPPNPATRRRSTAPCKRGVSTTCATFFTPFSPPFPTTGIAKTVSPNTKAIMRRWSTVISPPLVWTSPPKMSPTGGVSTSRYVWADGCS